MPNEKILLILSDPKIGQLVEKAALIPAGYEVTLATEWQTAEGFLQDSQPDLIIISDHLDDRDTIDLVKGVLEQQPFLPVIMIPNVHSDGLAIKALRQGFADYLQPPVKVAEVKTAIQRALSRRQQWQEWAHLETNRDTNSLKERVNSLESIQRIGRQVTSLLDLDSVLTAVVDAAVDLTNAEEGSLLLLDENTGELYMRAGRNFQEDFVGTFRLPVSDSLAGQVLRTGKPLLMDEKTPQKIKTSYLVYTIIYVPLIVEEHVIGVLEVDNRQGGKPFSDYDVVLVSALADYAAIAIANARLYSHTEFERSKLETILTKIEEGVIVIDHDGRLMLVNRRAREAFGVGDNNITGKRVSDVIRHPELLETLKEKGQASPARIEISLEDARVLNAQITPISEVGIVVTMQDITYLKELDRIKSDFVNTVSHDLRSPLTAILGYVELVDRVGPINDQQKEFIRRVQLSVHSITALINDLLDLGRIEAGFDVRMEVTPFDAIIHYAIDGLRNRLTEKSQELVIDVPETLPQVLGNPIRLRQLLNNLIANAIKYTPEGGEITVQAHAEEEQVIVQVCDNGPGIPPTDQPYIFDKFYRASNIPTDTPGTGLGLAIVRSIVENHMGRIWVDSNPGEGTTFTVVLPTINAEM